MSDKMTQEQRDVLNLIARSPDRGNGWRTCSPVLFDKLISSMPDSLVEKTAWNAGYEIVCDGEIDDDPFQIVIRKKGADDGS
jgi:hypothetical protein